jgi:prophage regulatory protein
MNEAQTPRIWRLPTVKSRTGLSRSTIYQAIADRTFPSPIHLGRRSVGWISHEIEDWIAARVTASRTPPSPAAR